MLNGAAVASQAQPAHGRGLTPGCTVGPRNIYGIVGPIQRVFISIQMTYPFAPKRAFAPEATLLPSPPPHANSTVSILVPAGTTLVLCPCPIRCPSRTLWTSSSNPKNVYPFSLPSTGLASSATAPFALM